MDRVAALAMTGFSRSPSLSSCTRRASGIGVTAPDGFYRLLFREAERLCWPDAISAGPDGFTHVNVKKLRAAELNPGRG